MNTIGEMWLMFASQDLQMAELAMKVWVFPGEACLAQLEFRSQPQDLQARTEDYRGVSDRHGPVLHHGYIVQHGCPILLDSIRLTPVMRIDELLSASFIVVTVTNFILAM